MFLRAWRCVEQLGNLDMRHAQSDARKTAKGTLKGNERWGDKARALRAIGSVLTFPQLQEIPEPSIELGGPGTKAFHFWCSSLLRNNLLTAVSIGFTEAYALNEDKIHASVAAGKVVTDRSLEVRRSMLLKFEALNVDSALVPDQGKKTGSRTTVSRRDLAGLPLCAVIRGRQRWELANSELSTGSITRLRN